MPEPSALPTRHVASTRIVAVRGDSLEIRADRVVGEEPLEIRVAGPGQEPVAVAVTMRTPGNEDELAIGFLRTEGLIDGSEVRGVRFGDAGALAAPDDTVLVRLDRPFDASKVADRHFVATASCGICGKASIEEVALRVQPLPPGPTVRRTVILGLPDALRGAQQAFDATGGLHAAGLFTSDGGLVAIREDVGRHNALDKVIGSQVVARALPLHQRILMVSGRVSFEIVQKAAVAGIPILCAVSAPSSLAIDAAERFGMTLVGFLRGDAFNVYAHDGRIDLDDLRVGAGAAASGAPVSTASMAPAAAAPRSGGQTGPGAPATRPTPSRGSVPALPPSRTALAVGIIPPTRPRPDRNR